jgi:hypothetical protein
MIASADPDSVRSEPPSLFALLAMKARGASDAMLAMFAGIGGITAIVLIAVRPRWWAFVLPLVSAGALGLWGMLERATAERGSPRSDRYDRAVNAAQWLLAAIGMACAIIAAFAVLGLVLGTIIS